MSGAEIGVGVVLVSLVLLVYFTRIPKSVQRKSNVLPFKRRTLQSKLLAKGAVRDWIKFKNENSGADPSPTNTDDTNKS